ncbi:MAG: hypothetical protein HUU38_13065 [Anaerolineales bacterium]|nr:hypothetical protein [Anaerolineales bacterium]
MKRFLLLLSLLAFLTACAPITRTEQAGTDLKIPLAAESPVGQTFVADYDGLMGVELTIRANETSTVQYSLMPVQEAEERLVFGEIILQPNSVPVRVYLPMDKRFLSAQTAYSLVLSTDSPTPLTLRAAPGNTYLHGSAYQNGAPLPDAQLAFRLVYDPLLMGWGVLKEMVGYVGLLFVGLFLFVVPGWALLAALWRGWEALDGMEKLAASAGLSVALYPVMLLWAYVVHLPLGVWFASPAGVGAVYLLWKRFKSPPPPTHQRTNHPLTQPTTFLSLLILFILLLARLWAIRGLEIPLWGDSYQHAMITQLVVENGGLFQSWAPYEPYTTLTVHFGFYAGTATWIWLTGMDVNRAVLVVGQLFNGVAVLALYPLGKRLANGNPWGGLGALVVGGVLLLPAYYVNWGRYSQLTGQVILPVALWLAWKTLEADAFDWKKVLISGLALAGMTLSYYRMPFFFAGFVVILLLGWGLPSWRFQLRAWGAMILRLGGVGLIGVGLFLPWADGLLGGNLGDFVVAGVVKTQQAEVVLRDFETWRTVPLYYPKWALGLSGLAFLLALVRKKWLVVLLPVWLGLLPLYILGQLVNMPGANMIQNFTVQIALYLPIAFLIGELLAWGTAWSNARWKGVGAWGATLLVLFLLGSALKSQLNIVNQPLSAIVTVPDLRAMAWIQTHTPPDARFLVEGFRIYGGTSAVGADAGWWIPLLTGRKNTMPPQYPMFTEQSVPPDYSKQVVELVKVLEETSPTDPPWQAALCAAGVTHAYFGQQQGQAGVGVPQLFSPEELEGLGVFERVYFEDRVRIYAFDRAGCAP